jgi:hypothetical protein
MIGAAVHLSYHDNFVAEFYFTNIRLAFSTFGVTDFIIIDQTRYKTGQYFHATEFNVHHFLKLEECEKQFKDKATFVYLEPSYIDVNSISLHDFEHPESAIYVVGADRATIPVAGRENAKWVYIPSNMESGYSMYAETAIMFPLYDRSVKTWQ